MSEQTKTKTALLNNNWLDGAEVKATAVVGSGSGCLDYTTGNSWFYYTDPWSYRYYSFPTKIKLTMTEVEVLREAAKKNPKLKKALKKFGPHIEVEVDFP